jgi:hypothetical protein
MSLTMEAPVTTARLDANTDVSLDDRRCAPRAQRALAAEVRLVGISESRCCDVEDISEGGLFIFVPLSYGMNVGQRCEVLFSATHSSISCPTDEVCYATVVRTEVIVSDSGKRLGAGLRFDQPLFL